MNVRIKYHDERLTKLQMIDGGDWCDLRAAESVSLDKGVAYQISLGISMEIPEGYEAHIVPRSSTYKKWKIIQVNGIGIIDGSYSGNNDVWSMYVYAMEDTHIHFDDRICQFRIIEKQPRLSFTEVEDLGNPNRGGFGSTGHN